MKKIRCYNKSYMESHNIGWYFIFEGIPCYSLSNGLNLPEVIKVSTNRRFQDYLYRDILKECEPFLSHTDQDKSYKQIQYELFINSDSLEIYNKGILNDRQLESNHYLTVDDVFLFTKSIEYVLSKDFCIKEPSLEQLNSIIQAYAGMVRRGFSCFYPFWDYQSEGMSLMPIAMPKPKDINTMASYLKPYLPKHNASVVIPSRWSRDYPAEMMSWSTKLD